MSAEAPAPPAPSEARLRAEARKAKIQARGADRLAKLANTARGEDGAKLYEDAAPLAPRPTASTNASSSSLATLSTPAGAQQPNPFAGMDDMFPGFPPAAAAGGGDPFAAMLQAIQAGGEGPGGPLPLGGGGGLGGDDDPFAAMLNSMTAGAGGGAGGFPPGFGQQQQHELEGQYTGEKTRLDRVFDVGHVLAVVGLAAFVLRWWEPAVWAKRHAGNFVDLGGFVRPATLATVELPVFWAFVTVSLILHTTRALLFRSRPPPSKLLSLAGPFLPLLPPRLKTYVFTASRYLSVATQSVQDLCLLVFLLGVSRWVGGDGTLGNIVRP